MRHREATVSEYRGRERFKSLSPDRLRPVALIDLGRIATWGLVRNALLRAQRDLSTEHDLSQIADLEYKLFYKGKLPRQQPLCNIERMPDWGDYYTRYCPDFPHHQLAVAGNLSRTYRARQDYFGPLRPNQIVHGLVVIDLSDELSCFERGVPAEAGREQAMLFATAVAAAVNQGERIA
jgi:hypothetical protein